MTHPRAGQHSTYVVCIDNTDYAASLEKHKIYRAIHDTAASAEGDIRIIDESGEDYLYPAEYFVVIKVPRQSAQALAKSFDRGVRHAA